MQKRILTLSIALAPSMALAASSDLGQFIGTIGKWINSILPIVFTLALLFFVWNGIRLVRADDKGRDEAKQALLWGVVAMFVIFSIWGIVAFLQRSTIGSSSTNIDAPYVPGTN